MIRVKKLMGDQLKYQQLTVQKEIESELMQKMERTEQKEQKKQKDEESKEQVQVVDIVEQPKAKVQEEDVVMNITNKKKKDKKRAAPEPVTKEAAKEATKEAKAEEAKRVRFDLSQNKITEFFKHGKVAQRTFEL